MFELVDSAPQSAVIKVVGVGGGGGNAVQHMVTRSVDGVDFVAANTDAQALKSLDAQTTLQIGSTITKGLGAGANPDVGRAAALEDKDRIAEVRKYLSGVVERKQQKAAESGVQYRQADGGSGRGSQNAPFVHFGLGTTTTIDSVVVEWPSGLRSVELSVVSNDTLSVTEPQPLFTNVAASAGVETSGNLKTIHRNKHSFLRISRPNFSALATILR